MLKTILAGTPSPTNVRECIGAGENKLDHGNKVGKVGRNQSKGENLSKINLSKACFLTSKASIAFTCLQKSFTKAPILHYFDPERYIRIQTNASSFAISAIFCQLSLEHMTYTNSDLCTSKIC